MDTESHSSGNNIDVSPCMRTGDCARVAVAFKPSHFTRGKDGFPNDIAPPLSADADKGDQDTVIAIDGANQVVGENVHHSLRTGRDSDDGVAFAFAQNQSGEVRVNSDAMGTVNQNQNASGRNTPMIQAAMQVRRLTPTECCRLQGFPDDYLDIPYRGKPAADGPKYRALGNSMAVPCMWWIGRRIQQATESPT